MNQGKHVIQRTRYNSPVIAIITNKKSNNQVVTTNSKSRLRKKRFGIFTKERGVKDEY